MRLLIYGLGRSGLAALRLAARHGADLEFYDRSPSEADVSAAVEAGARQLMDPVASRASTVVAAPGVPIDHPHLIQLAAAGAEIIGEVELVQRLYPENRLAGITGTAGKGTVTSMIQLILETAGVDSVAGGNLDPALSAVVRPGAVLVTELSSFQLERAPGLRPAVAVALNLGSDHLDRHGSVEQYHAVKRNLISNMDGRDAFIYNRDDPALQEWARNTAARSLGFSLETGEAASVRDGVLHLHGLPLMDASDLRVKGPHNQANALAAALAAYELGADRNAIRAGLTAFQGLPGRYSTVARIGSITFIEDSIATRPLAVRAALEASRGPVVWLAGGQGKGAGTEEFRELARRKVSLLIGFGASGPAFVAGLKDAVPTMLIEARDGRQALRQAVTAAAAHLKAHSRSGGTVLLAPLAASFDQFSNYSERGQVFREEVERLEVRWTVSS